MSSLSPSSNTENLPIEYKGYIDWVASGFIRGWVYSPQAPNQPIAFKVLLNGQEILQSTADLFREDLVTAGIGNGVHGFCCNHNSPESLLSGSTLQLVDVNNQTIGKPYVVPPQIDLTVNVNDVYSTHCLCNVELTLDKAANVTLQLFHGNTRFWQGVRALKAGKNHLALPVCEEINDQAPHLLTLGVVGKYNALWQQNLSIEKDQAATAQFELAKNAADKPVIVMIDRSIPKPDKDAGSYAAITEARLLQSLGYHIVFIPDDFTYSPKYTEQLQALGVEVLYSPCYISSAHALRAVLPKASAVYITRYHFVEKHIKTIKTYSATLPVIFNNADLHFLREIRQANQLNDATLLSKAKKTRERELKAMQQVDAILSYSEFEHAVITSHLCCSDNIYKCPWVVEPPAIQKSFNQRKGVAFLGGYEHPANIEAVQFFIEQVMPILRAQGSGITVSIYGSHMPDFFNQYASDDVFIKGYVESLDDVYLNHRVFIAPLFFGAGVKGKVLAAAAYGMPCVLSPIAIEATGLVHNVSTLVAETPQQWAESVQRLYRNKKTWQFISKNQQALVQNNYSFEKSRSMMQKVLTDVGLPLLMACEASCNSLPNIRTRALNKVKRTIKTFLCLVGYSKAQ